jgi:glutamate transport system permease protein
MLEILSRYDFMSAFWTTIQLSFWGTIGSLLLGTLVAILRVSPVPVLRAIGTGYVNTIRNTPLTLMMVFSILGLTYIMGLELAPSAKQNAFLWAIVMLSLYHATYVCEALRSGVNTIPVGQAEAARSIGLTFGQSLSQVLLPQAFRASVAPLGSAIIALIKNSTVAAMIGVPEAAELMSVIVENETGTLGVFFVFAVGFLIMTFPLGVFTTWLSEKVAVKR